MALTHSVKETWTGSGTATVSGTVTKSAEGEDNRSLVVAALASNLQVDCAFDTARLVMAYLLSTKEVTLKTNSTSVPDDTLVLKAGVPLVWTNDDAGSNPFTVDVTTLYLSNAGAVDSQVDIRLLLDPTP